MPVPGNAGQRARRGERPEVAPAEAGPARQLGDPRERAAGAGGDDAPGRLAREPPHAVEAEAQRLRAALRRLERRFHRALVDAGGQHGDAVRARVAHQLRRRVEAHRLAVEERAAEGGGLVPLEPGRDVDQQREARGMRFREAVLAEAEDLLEHLPREALVVAARAHALDQALLERAERALAPPGRHRAPQAVGLAGRETRGHDRELHHLLLEDRHAERAREHALHLRARIVDRLLAAPPAQVRMHHLALDRAGTDDRDLDGKVVIALRPEPRQHRHLRARLDLEHADRVGAADHLVDGRILGRDVRQAGIPSPGAP